jgi:hypothetical protein
MDDDVEELMLLILNVMCNWHSHHRGTPFHIMEVVEIEIPIILFSE